MSDIMTRMKNAHAKSDSDVTLFEHSYGVLRIVDHMIRVTPNYPLQQAAVLRLGAFLHDIGKLHPEFQRMLQNPNGQDKWVKHEGQTYLFEKDVETDLEALARWMSHDLACEMTLPEDLSDVLAFAVTHHGVFYSSLEKGVWRARREWTRMEPQEERRITLADLLIRYYPLGGAVIFADLLHSHQIATKIDHTTQILYTRHPQEWRAYLQEQQDALSEAKEADRITRLPHDLLELLLA
jgi:hypothetical protein